MEKHTQHRLLELIKEKLGTNMPSDYYSAELFNYNFGEGKSDRWRVNFLCKKFIETECSTIVDKFYRPMSWFLHYNEVADVVTYCNPPIEGLVSTVPNNIDVSESQRKSSKKTKRRVSDTASSA